MGINNPLISVIIPVYNAEMYLAELLTDIVNQTYQELEIIIINDGSTDHSLEIIKEFEKRDKRIKIVSVQNGGVSKARNIGLDCASGEYIRFIDADDRIPINSMQNLIDPFLKFPAVDLSIGNFKVEPKLPIFTGETNKSELVSGKKFAERFVERPRTYYYGVLWNKIYRLSIIRESQIHFIESLSWCEDLLFNIQYYVLANNICFVNKEESVYHYRMKVENSLTDKIEKDKHTFEKIEKDRYNLLYEYFSNYNLQDIFRTEWENVNLYYRITNIVKKQSKSDSLKLRYERFLQLVSREDTYSYLYNKKNSFGKSLRFILLLGIKHKSYHFLFIFFIIKGKISTLLGKYSKKIKKMLGFKIPADY